jgi:hypothetical protein
MHSPKTLAIYFQQLWPLSKCEAHDGMVVGHLLMDLVENKPKDPARAIRAFVRRVAMLRECGFGHIDAMLLRLLADDQSVPDDAAAIAVLSPSAVTEKQAIAIGNAIASSLRRSHTPVKALTQVVQSYVVLRAMKSRYVWFIPMLEVITAHKHGELHQPSWMKRLSSIVMAKVPTVPLSVVPSAQMSDAAAEDEESSFSSVVRTARRAF